jgi:hypothetical protein
MGVFWRNGMALAIFGFLFMLALVLAAVLLLRPDIFRSRPR